MRANAQHDGALPNIGPSVQRRKVWLTPTTRVPCSNTAETQKPLKFKMQVWNPLHAARWKYRTQKIAIWAPLHKFVGLYLRNYGTYRQSQKKLVKQRYVLHTCSQYGELRPTSNWDRSGSLRHPCKFQWVSRLGSVTARHLVVGVSQTLWHWTEGATYVRQGDHHVGHWPTFLVLLSSSFFPRLMSAVRDWMFTILWHMVWP